MQTTEVPTMTVLSKKTGEEAIINVGDFDGKLHKMVPAEEEIETEEVKSEKPAKADKPKSGNRSKLTDAE